ncbi:hypothetical protein BD31_I1566 [Candidatus Nitrosopumilus salaria BD31]|uniref:site-specific DNA-methyltransferase (adenine-specific) n=1 Tax=Candidatus Nitrosopumilus salarius BD31 TaxID=859350 RepID=I3D1L1_9ARCH|nr:N-6 DNA methylase [Candidatus Nitrosopumilus salaria]EIJ65604.1 hypothetical protein BD31_I1566 [Candidatus Nitrosopumilus salaria BD31]
MVTTFTRKKLGDEKSNYPKFMQIVLQDILGYPIKELDFEKDNVEFQFSNSEGKKILCFEAKGTSTKDLFSIQHRTKKEHETPIKQTWDYMGSIGLDYGICTNYEDFVLITKQFGYSKYHLFNFNSINKNEDKLKEFIGIFSKQRIITEGFVEKLYDKSVTEEREFTEEFYKLFHETRLMLIKAFQEKQNVTNNEAIYFTQLFLNRLIFIFFVEDKGFLSNKQLFSDRILKLLESGQSTEHSKKVYDEITELFTAFDKGSQSLGVFGFNGGLFSGVLPSKIFFFDLKDPKFFAEVRQYSKLQKSTKLNEKAQGIIKKYRNQLNPIITNLLLMDSFDFNSDVNVNILGHIFEQSISDLEELKKEGVTRRKKEGVFYTPEYVTDYICRNAIIPYLSKSGVTTVPELINEYEKDIDELELKFKEIKIVDPACGSGAFLIKAIDVLLEIHKEIQIMKDISGKYSSGGQFQLTKWNEETEIRMIVENNIYGVDINSESVEITQLSLFLKLASNNRKLIGLSKNIKVGNSLINDKTFDERAFSWDDEFPEIMKFDKFDVVIGNPPYIRQELFKEIKPYLKNSYQVYHSVADLFVYFIELGIHLLKENGVYSIIVSNKFAKTEYGEKLRNFLLNYDFQSFIDFGDLRVFDDASTYPCILTVKKSKPTETISVAKVKTLDFFNLSDYLTDIIEKIPISSLGKDSWSFSGSESAQILEKLKKDSTPFEKIVNGKFYAGIKTGFDEAFVIDESIKNELINEDENSKEVIFPFLGGREVKRARVEWKGNYIIFTRRGIDISQYPAIEKHLKKYQKKLEPKKPGMKEGRKPGPYKWYEIQDNVAYWKMYLDEGIIYTRLNKSPNFAISKPNFLPNTSGYQAHFNERWLLGILNSKVTDFFLSSICPSIRGGYFDYRSQYVSTIPIPNSPLYRKELTKLEISIINDHEKLFSEKQKLLNRVKEFFNIDKISENLENFQKLTFQEFIKEVSKKSRKKPSLKELDEWDDYFNGKKSIVLKLKNKIEKYDKQVDEIVFKMYELTDEDIKIIENELTIKT